MQYGVTIGHGIGTGFLASLGAPEAAINKEMAGYGDAIATELVKALHGDVKLTGASAAGISSALSSAAWTPPTTRPS